MPEAFCPSKSVWPLTEARADTSQRLSSQHNQAGIGFKTFAKSKHNKHATDILMEHIGRMKYEPLFWIKISDLKLVHFAIIKPYVTILFNHDCTQINQQSKLNLKPLIIIAHRYDSN